jgi:hypothetical protein
MKALSLTQPWASLVAFRAKRIETRSWESLYRGPLAIHAPKGFPRWAKEFSKEPPVGVLLGPDYEYPRGKVLCIVKLMGCRRTDDVRGQLSAQELSFGDYSDGRFAWFLEFVELVEEQPEATGHLGLWNWSRELKG